MKYLLLLSVLIAAFLEGSIQTASPTISLSLSPLLEHLTQAAASLPTTFPLFPDQKPNRHPLADERWPEGFRVRNLEEYELNNCTSSAEHSSFPDRSFTKQKGFVRTVITAHVGRHNLIITPEDVWATILSQFYFYLKANPNETFETVEIPSFDGEMNLNIIPDAGFRQPTGQPNQLMKLIASQVMAKWADSPLKKWILPHIISEPIDSYKLLGAESVGVEITPSSEKYSKLAPKNGIPKITLKGSKQDWKNVAAHLDEKIEYGEVMNKWGRELTPILDQFLNAKEGKIDVDFWQKMVYYAGNNSDPDGNSTSNLVSGWITLFSTFDKNGNRLGKEYSH